MKHGQHVTGKACVAAPIVIDSWTGKYSDEERRFQGIASIAVSKGGRLWAAWYGGGDGEGQENYVMLSTSGDHGHTWVKRLVVDSQVRVSEPLVWIDTYNRLWLMWGQYPHHLKGPESVNYRLISADPEREDAVFSTPEPFSHEITFNKPTMLSSGRCIFPSGIWDPEEPSRPIYTDDECESFQYGGDFIVGEGREFDEYQIVERRDGTLWLLTRTAYGLAECFSTDNGMTWSPVTRSRFEHVTSRFFISRLASGRLLWIRHGQPHERLSSRRSLVALLSEDDGMTWSEGILIDPREPVSYPDAVQASDGRLFVIYDRERHDAKEILMVELTEERILSKTAVQAEERKIVNKASGLKRPHAK